MPSLKEVKNRIGSVISTQQITKAMKMVAAAKLRKSQDRIMRLRPFAESLSGILRNLSAVQDADPGQNWFSDVRPEEKVLIVAVSSDRGLCGSFNSNIHKAVVRLAEQRYPEQLRKGNLTILPLGRKAFEYFSKRKYSVDKSQWTIFKDLSFNEVAASADYLMELFRTGKFDKIEIVYNEFKNVATQILRTEQFLPIVPQEETSGKVVDYIYQPDRDTVMTGLIPKMLRTQLFKAVLDSNAAENGARMTAMDKATENAGELLKELRLTYNRTRQAAITKEILEIVGGAEALRSS